MQPTLQNNEFGIMDVHDRTLMSLERFDIIVIQQNPSIDRFIIKRILGLPGETLAFETNGTLLINDVTIDQPFYDDTSYVSQTCSVATYIGCEAPISLHNDAFFVSGDNRPSSLDSRTFGPIQRSIIIGKLIAIEGVCTASTGTSQSGVDLSNCASRTYAWPRWYV